MFQFQALTQLIEDEKRAREQGDASDSITARIAHFARADGYAAEIRAWWAAY